MGILRRLLGLDKNEGPHFVPVVALKEFPLFAPCSAGDEKALGALTVQSINQLVPRLVELCREFRHDIPATEPINQAPIRPVDAESAEKLRVLFDLHGSDKASSHDYHHLYGTILSSAEEVSNILEVGLGTNNIDVVSNMGSNGKPGASLRAFRDHCPNAQVYGADIDSRILFQEDRIRTFPVDQTKPDTFEALLKELPPGAFDLVIDDGLHAPNANLLTLRYGMRLIRVGGWVVIEDISMDAACLWQAVAACLPHSFKVRIFKGRLSTVFAVQRLS